MLNFEKRGVFGLKTTLLLFSFLLFFIFSSNIASASNFFSSDHFPEWKDLDGIAFPELKDMNCIFLLAFVFIVGIILIIIGFWLKDYTFAALGSIGLLVYGLYLMSTGICWANNFVSLTVSFICLGIGLYVLIRGGLELIEESYD